GGGDLSARSWTPRPRSRRAWLLRAAASLVLVVAAAGCGSSTPSSSSSTSSTSSASSGGSSTDTIVIKNFAFSPSTDTVDPGATITVKNEDSGITHTLTAIGGHAGAFTTGDITGPNSGTFVAPTTPGTYSYDCQIHQYMTGTLIVR
ncbi:MAG: cupredoxin domain-containing protein, partial [Acidimicrobiales bacterium]